MLVDFSKNNPTRGIPFGHWRLSDGSLAVGIRVGNLFLLFILSLLNWNFPSIFQSRFAINSVTLGDYDRPLNISRFVGDLSSGFRLLNLKNDGLRKRFDALKYDVKKIEEVVYDIKIRGLTPGVVAVNEWILHCWNSIFHKK